MTQLVGRGAEGADGGDGADEVARPDIAASWRRASMAGVQHVGVIERLVPADVDPRSSLLVGAGPVLEQLELSLAGTGYLTIVADRECRVVRRWFDDPATRDSLDALNIREGVSLLEDVVGTNGLGTVFETRDPVIVRGSEHFAESLRRFSCYGHPIRHPLTRRIEGVLNIASRTDTESRLLPPIIARAVHDIEQRLLGGSRVSEKSLLAAFQEASGHRRRAVLAIGEDIVMCNRAASALLSPADIALLRVLAEDPPAANHGVVELTLESGRAAAVTVERVPSARRAVLLHVEERTAEHHSAPPVLPAASLRAAPPTLVSGPAGTGRSTRARELSALPTQVLRAATALLEGAPAWAHDLASALERTEGSLIVDGIDLLPDELLDLVIEGAEQPRRPQLVLTSGPLTSLTGRAATLAAMAMVQVELTPLSSRRAELPDLATSMLKTVAASDSVHLTPGVVQALAAHDWPGNLRELKAVITHVASRRTAGGIVVDDLPEQYRAMTPLRPLSALDQAERDAIVVALRAEGGNKVRAARVLGVSRTTLYARIRQLRITTY